jgi:hypothetical protein
MNLREELLRGIYGYGFEKPSAIQQRAIAPCIKVRKDDNDCCNDIQTSYAESEVLVPWVFSYDQEYIKNIEIMQVLFIKMS